MKARAPLAALAALVATLVACRTSPETQHPPTAPAVDPDGKGTVLGAVCEELRAAGCPEGFPLREGRTCYGHLSDLGAWVTIDTECLLKAKTPAIVRTCGGPHTLRFRCLQEKKAPSAS